MSRREVDRRLDEIVEFAGLERFMDTPVKRYSSGMYLRLGFAIAAHLEADILVVDEVLAVGDAEFQRRCLGKMSEVEQSGRTVLFVSHNMDAMARLCPTAIWLEARASSGDRADRPAGERVRAARRPPTCPRWCTRPTRRRPPRSSPSRCVTAPANRRRPSRHVSEAVLEIEVVVNDAVPGLDVGCMLSTTSGAVLLDELLSDVAAPSLDEPGRYRIRCTIPPVLPPGQYAIGIVLGTHYELIDSQESAVSFAVDGDDLGRTRRLFKLGLPWSVQRLDDHLRPPG